MKEFRTKIGGRKIYNEDFDNLQNLVLAALSFFKDCSLNYVISGCEVTDNTVEEGYVCLEGQIRKVEKTTISNSQRPVITPVTQVISKKYEDGNVSPISTVYGTRIIPSNEYVSEVGIQSLYNKSTGKYEFEKIIDTFWDNYTLVKEGAKMQDVNVNTMFTDVLKTIGVIIKKQNKSVKLTKDTIYFYDNTAISSYIKIGGDGEVSFFNKDNDVLFKLNGSGNISVETIKKVVAMSLEAQVVTAGKLTVGENDIKDAFFTVEEYADTGWHNLVRAKNGEEIPNLFARSYMGIVHIQGTLPADTFTDLDDDEKYRNLSSGYGRRNKLLNIKLPEAIPAPSEDYVNSFNVITPIYGTVGVNIFLDKDTKRFYITDVYDSQIIGDLRPATDKGLNLFSFPFYGINENDKSVNQAVRGITTTNSNIAKTMGFPDNSVCPSVSWQYSADVPVELHSYTYKDAFNFTALFNPDSDILHINATFVRLAIIVNLKTKKAHSVVVVNEQAAVSGFTYTTFDNSGNESNVNEKGITYMTDPCVRKYAQTYNGGILTDDNYWPTSFGFKLNNLKDVKKSATNPEYESYYDKIKITVHFQDTQYYKNHTETKEIFDRPCCKFSLKIGAPVRERKINDGALTIRKLARSYFYIDTILWEYYEVLYRDSNGKDTYYSNEVTDKNATGDISIITPCFYEILDGLDYIELKETVGCRHYYGWTNLALTAELPFKIKVRMWLDSYLVDNKKSIYGNGKDGNMEGFEKTAEITIYPKQYALTQYERD